ncbi:NahK/ErcS family hybrid sensor histidine kinase/response regulator [Novispirillum sp. DQ9]|uniref:NahK/ErcS family hybrid sensor histidine kinase/response regulator n=1 Tax=Novispirillum sp. DQ9 TaxID=3398612 RepID=UPI003C7A4E49
MTPPLPAPTEDPRLADLERENAKLRKINRVLMDRVERSMDFQGNAFSLFQTSIVLESRIRERTLALESVMRELGTANDALSAAKAMLSEAIESISEGFVLCDAADRVVLTNSKYREMWPFLLDGIDDGLTFEELLRRAAASGIVAEAAGDPGGWVARRLAHHRAPGEPFVIQFIDGLWLQVSERRTRDGGTVGLYTDITEIKVSEKRRRERELAEKSVLLQATLDNLSQGVSVFDRSLRLVAWNQRFAELLQVPAALLRPGAPLDAFGALPGAAPPLVEHETDGGRVLEVRRNAMPDGGFVTTYTDITERKRSEEALRDSERRIRLVTDAMPALIAYVDAEERYRFTNKAYEDWFGRPRSEINGKPMREVLGPQLYDGRQAFVAQALAGGECSFEMTLPQPAKTGALHALATYVPHLGPEGQVLGFFALIHDITERRRAAEALRESKEGLERRVQERTAELRRANRDLKAAKQAADQANLSKTRFLAAASHDLLQPLAAARVFTSALADRRMAPRNRALVRSSLAALDSVDGLLAALLDISKLDAGVLPVERQPVRLCGLLAPIAEEHRALARAKGLDLRVLPCSAVVDSDPRLLGRIIRNFISNAIRYTDTGRVVIGCRRRGDAVMLGVWDTGSGIPGDKLEEIFEEFHRLQRPSERGERGMGLGLAIVRRIARMLDHGLTVRSTLGRGSLFGVTLPVVAPGTQPCVEEPRPARPPVPAQALAGARILMIDNEPDILLGMAALLEGWGCRTRGAASQEEALAVLADTPAEARPQVLIADYHLDDNRHGLEAIAAVRAALGTALPALVITANHSPELVREVQDANAHLLNKPVRPGRLRSVLAHLLMERKG